MGGGDRGRKGKAVRRRAQVHEGQEHEAVQGAYDVDAEGIRSPSAEMDAVIRPPMGSKKSGTPEAPPQRREWPPKDGRRNRCSWARYHVTVAQESSQRYGLKRARRSRLARYAVKTETGSSGTDAEREMTMMLPSKNRSALWTGR
jgi:hypothetical protein